jgi:3-hydroxyacyl-CoA dehydrogenase
MTYQIRKVAVLGAGVMGSAIAAHLANVDIPSLLLDIVPPGAEDRNSIARKGLERVLQTKPAAFYSKRKAELITIGNIEDDLAELANVDWIIEAVVEQLEIKRDLYSRIETVIKPDTIISSNTSGLPAHQLVEGRSEQFRHHFLITHFFNPVRYMHLLEIVPNIDTDPLIVQFMQQFATDVLGKGVVICKDTPNFIANRIGIYSVMSTIKRAIDEGYTVSEVDTILGPYAGRPKSAVFRTADLTGLDVLVDVSDNLYGSVPDDNQREAFRVPSLLRELVSRGWLGEKRGQGFYKRVKGSDGESTILELNLHTLGYEPRQKPRFDSIGTARHMENLAERMTAIMDGDDRASQLLRETTADGLIYAAENAQEIADDIVAIDNAMRWGFNFEMGSFEMWDMLLQHPATLRRVFEGRSLPELVQRVQSKGQGTFYLQQDGEKQYFDFNTDTYRPIPVRPGVISLAAIKAGTARKGVVRDNGSAALVDLGDGIGCVEFHTKVNAIDEGIVEMLHYSVEEGSKQFRALVIGNETENFSAGANLVLIVMGAQQGMWDVIDQALLKMQHISQLLKYSNIPVVAALAGRALGGGCEIVMHCSHTRALAESYIGLVETGIGLIPAGGGCKEMLLRYGASVEKVPKNGGPFTASARTFGIIGLATLATSAAEAQDLRFLRRADAITINRDLLLRDAKADAIKLAEAKEAGTWQPPQPSMLLLPGPSGRLILEQQVENMLLANKISEHDAIIGRHLARILTGGNASPDTPVTEQHVLDLEREAFLSLCGMEKTQERIQAVLATGKPLRN